MTVHVARLSRRVAPECTDAEVLQAVATGDVGALGELYDRHAARVLSFVARANRADDAEDIVQTTFLRVLTLASSFDPNRPSARPWLCGIAFRVLRERRRSLARWFRAALVLGRTTQAAAAPPTILASDLEQALARLTEAKRIVLLLAEVEGFSGPEIAEITGVPVGTVWTRLHHARQELRRHLEDT